MTLVKVAALFVSVCATIIFVDVFFLSSRIKQVGLRLTPMWTSQYDTSVKTEFMGIKPAGPRNPGCKARKIGKYRPVDTGVVYQHPSLIQYAKLTNNRTATTVQLTFMEYVAVMSAYKFLQPKKIMFHTYTEISGKYWDLIQKWNVTVIVNKVDRVERLGGKVVPDSLVTHQADFIKVRGLLEFGGTISDFDVIIINGSEWKRMQRSAECVLSQEYVLINAGFNSCVRNSSFAREWLRGYYTDYKTYWLYNASERPRSILEDGHTDVCYNMLVVDGIATNPNWSHFPQWLVPNGVDWRRKVAAHYFNADLKNYGEERVQARNSFGELLRYVLEA